MNIEGKYRIIGTYIHRNKAKDVYEYGKGGAYERAGICHKRVDTWL